MGFYPVPPGTPTYLLGSPLFKKVTLQLKNGKTFTVQADENAAQNVYIQSVRLNGAAHAHTWLSHADIVKGGILHLRMGNQPNTRFGGDPQAAPYSFSRAEGR